jgi:Flp pilus assembly pilin Flp
MNAMLTAMRRLAARDDGQDLLEYGLLAVLIAVVAMSGVTTLGKTIYDIFWREIGLAL